MNKLISAILSFRSRKDYSQETSSKSEPLSLQNQIQTLRMDLEDSQQKIFSLKQEIERLRSRQDEVISTALNSRFELLFSDISAPVSQVLTQVFLYEEQSVQIQPGDILAVMKRILRALERCGMTLEGKPGEEVKFNPGRHVPVDSNQAIESNQPVTVRFAGISYQGKMIYKAIVEQEN